MKLNDYKRAMGRLTVSGSLREKIIVGASVGRAPKPTVSHRPRLTKLVSVVATAATLAAVVTAFVLIVRFVGPEGPANVPAPGFDVETTTEVTEATDVTSPTDTRPSQNGPISYTTDCKDVGFNVYSITELYLTRSIRAVWTNPKGLAVTYSPEYTVKKLVDGEWSDAWVNTDVRFTDETVVHTENEWTEEYQLWRFGTDVEAGRYLIEKAFTVDGEAHTMSLELELADVSTYANGVSIGYVNAEHKEVSVTPAEFDGDKLYLDIYNGMDDELSLFPAPFKLEMQVGDAWETYVVPGGIVGEVQTVAPKSDSRGVYLDFSIYNFENMRGHFRLTQGYEIGLPDEVYDLVIEFDKYSFDKSDLGLVVPLSLTSDIGISNSEYIRYELVGYDKESGELALKVVADGNPLTAVSPAALQKQVGDEAWEPVPVSGGSVYFDYDGVYLTLNIKDHVEQSGRYCLIWAVTDLNGREGTLSFEIMLGA